MQFQVNDGLITVTFANQVFGKDTMNPTIVVAGGGRSANMSIKYIQQVVNSGSQHITRFLNGTLAVCKDIMSKEGFNDFDGAWLVEELAVECTTQIILYKCKNAITHRK